LLPEARLSRQVSYNEMLELASLGAGVMHSRSIEFGKKFNVAIHVRSSMSDSEGSLIVDHSHTETLPVSGAALTKDAARISIHDVPDVPGTIHQILQPICDRKILIDMIVQNVADAATADVSFTVPGYELEQAVQAVEPVVDKLGGRLGSVDDNVAKVSVVGMGMAAQTGVASRMFKALANEQVNLQMITTSEIKISALVPASQALTALRIVHNEFDLDKGVAETGGFDFDPAQKTGIDALEVIDRLQLIGMESLTIDDIILDDTQSRITITKVPNQAGTAAELFEQVARKDVFVDMIVQSYARDQFADISFTVPREQAGDALTVANEFKEKYHCEDVESQLEIAKLTVSGIGLQSHTGVAIGTFEALMNSGINVEMINTSEVRVNVVVDGKQAAQGLDCLQRFFQDFNR
jgi:aspartate kinase